MLWHSLLTCSVSFGQNGKSNLLTCSVSFGQNGKSNEWTVFSPIQNKSNEKSKPHNTVCTHGGVGGNVRGHGRGCVHRTEMKCLVFALARACGCGSRSKCQGHRCARAAAAASATGTASLLTPLRSLLAASAVVMCMFLPNFCFRMDEPAVGKRAKRSV